MWILVRVFITKRGYKQEYSNRKGSRLFHLTKFSATSNDKLKDKKEKKKTAMTPPIRAFRNFREEFDFHKHINNSSFIITII